MRIIHISSAGTNINGGMSRVSHHWLKAFCRANLETISFDPTTVAVHGHNSFLGLKLRAAARPLLRKGDVLLVHEPLAGAFTKQGFPLVVFSHGIETRLRQVTDHFHLVRRRWKYALSFPLWVRQRQEAIRGLRMADLVLVLNSTDKEYLEERKLCCGQIAQYRNGLNLVGIEDVADRMADPGHPKILFLGTWLVRKGIRLIRAAYQHFRLRDVSLCWRFAGTQVSEADVRSYLGAEDDPKVEVIPNFCGSAESAVFSGCGIFVLPSFREGQSLALLEAMNRGLCCLATAADGQLDLLCDASNGLLFPVDDSLAFIASLEKVIGNAKLRMELGTRARADVQGCSWESVSDEVVEMVVSMLQR